MQCWLSQDDAAACHSRIWDVSVLNLFLFFFFGENLGAFLNAIVCCKELNRDVFCYFYKDVEIAGGDLDTRLI